ncbi:MAG: fumarylacetoacetate hydrolase family protein [Acidimicrobiia bacterium]|nr:fumarylacetoacetate hydrolase family protein [Acidimicrobiia bacterium]MDH4307103.1 fumarylacetoacetate hydrolase family protein [Acidimicrobiia bacterium]
MSELADRLVSAVRTRTALDPGATGLTPEAAYDVQDEVVSALGPGVAAIKLGLTSKAKQVQMSVDEPLYGWLVDGTEIHRGDPLVAGELIQPRVEPEIAFITSAELGGPGVSAAHVLAATSAVMAAIDVLDSRYAGYSFTLPDVIADNASAARFVVGDPIDPTGVDLRTVGCVFSKNGEMVATAAGAAILGHPAAAVAWFVRKLAERDRVLPAGSVVLAGALTAAIPVETGDSVTVEIDRLGTLELAVR